MTEQPPEIESYIDFRLKSLSERNEHHKFEDICVRIARKRISANIFVANGPVSSGGDQQRDGESYTTRIPDELPHSAGFAASASTTPVVVACTVQTGGMRAKILQDLAGICAPDAAEVDLVAFFSVDSIPEGTTHELQRIAREKYKVRLEVFSGMKIAVLLAEHDLLWIARYYLDLPSGMNPPPDDSSSAPRWYAETLDNLRRNRGPAALTPATQGEITEGLRHATWDADTNADLPEWLDFMGPFLGDTDEGRDSELVFRACYEMAVARFRGMGVGSGVEDLVRRAIDYACSSSRVNVLDDAVILASYWGVMWRVGVARAEASEIARAVEGLRLHLVDELGRTDSATYPVRAASLTGTLAYLHLLPLWENVERDYGRPEAQEVDPNAGIKLDEFEVDTSEIDDEIVDLGTALEYLSALVDLLPAARPYSVRSLARVFTMYAPALSRQSDYAKVRDGLDSALAIVDSDAAIADRCRTRAMAFVNAGKPLDALHDLHSAKARWFHGDSLYGAVLTTRYIGMLYRELGLAYAAKMYACGAAVIANQVDDGDLKRHLPAALFEAGISAHLAGCWIDAAALFEVAITAQNVFAVDPFDFEEHAELESAEINELMALVAIRRFWPELEELIRNAHPITGWYDHLDELAREAGDALPLNETQFQELADSQFAGPVLSDLGPRRTIDFLALGVRWAFTFNNTRVTALAAEGFCAVFQVFLADIARFDPVLIRSSVAATIIVVDGASSDVEIEDWDAEIRATITLSSDSSDLDGISSSLIAAAYQLLAPVHVRPGRELQDLLEPLIRDGLPHKVSVGRPFQEAADLLSDEHFERCAAGVRPLSSNQFRPAENAHLGASVRTGPGYDRAEALQLIRERYEMAEQGWRYSLAAILSDDTARAAIAELRADGWLDWQILVAIVNIGANWRVQQAGLPLQPAVLHQMGTKPEQEDDPRLPLPLVLDQLDFHMSMQTAAVAQRWSLRSRTEARGENAMRDLVARRYHYAEDDVPHRDLLSCLSEYGTLLPILDPADA